MLGVVWDLEDDPDGNVEHIAEHGVSPEEVEEVLNDPTSQTGRSGSSGRPITFGYTADGRPLGERQLRVYRGIALCENSGIGEAMA